MEPKEDYIKKEDLGDGVAYVGICRNHYVAVWDSSNDRFMYFKKEFQWTTQYLKHFDDVKDSGIDGFVPLEKLEQPKLMRWAWDFMRKIGYKKSI